MKAKYFSDTDTAHIEFSDRLIRETKEISENIITIIRAGKEQGRSVLAIFRSFNGLNNYLKNDRGLEYQPQPSQFH